MNANPDLDLAWRLLGDAVAADKRGKAGVALCLGCSRALLARVLSPNDPTGLSDKLARTIIALYHVVPQCPATGLPSPRESCRRLSDGPAPTHNPHSMRVWKTCQRCTHKPEVNS